MDITVLNSKFSPEHIIDIYESLIWTIRYDSYGDFELTVPAKEQYISILKRGSYISISESDRVMIVEDMRITSDSEDGNKLIVAGRSLESVLERRIIWGMQQVTGSVDVCIKNILDANIVSPSDPNRKISNFTYRFPDDAYIKSCKLDAQFTGVNLYVAVSSMCIEFGLGFKILLDGEKLVFELFNGADRSYSQTANPYVIFSPKFENLSNGSYVENSSDYKNAVLVGGTGEGADRVYLGIGEDSGLERRELFVDARDIVPYDEEGQVLDPELYILQLYTRGYDKLQEYKSEVLFEGNAGNSDIFTYQRDFFIGDIVQIEDEFGHSATARISEWIVSDDSSGLYAYPTFSTYHDGTGGDYDLQSKTVTPTTKPQQITPDEGYYGLSDVSVGAIPSQYRDVSAVTATAADVLTGKVIVTAAGAVTPGEMPNNGAVTKTLDTETTSYAIPAGYHNGGGSVSVTVEEKAIAPTKSEQVITPTTGKVLSKVTVAAIPANFIDTTDATAAATDILLGQTAYVNGVKLTGSMANNGDVSKTIDGLVSATFSIPAGYTTGGTVSLDTSIEDALSEI